MRTVKLNWRINHQINAAQVRVIGADKKQVGVMETSKALTLAQKEGLDLVEVAQNAKPPVVRIVELGKFRYEQEKKARLEKKRAKPPELKEVRLSPFIADHDFETRLEKIKEFLNDRHKVRVVVVFKMTQLDSKRFGYEILKSVVEKANAKIDMEPKFIGKHLIAIISPTNKNMNAENSNRK